MSENNQDNNSKEIIESEVESNDLSKQEVAAENNEEIEQDHQQEQSIEPTKETVVVKKGSFLSFLAFVCALAALGLSGYMYYLQYYKNKNTTTLSAWQQPIELVDKKIVQLNQQVATLQKNNQQLTKQIADLSVKATKIQALAESNTSQTDIVQQAEQVIEKYDDTALKSQLAEIEKTLSQPTNQKAIEKYDDKAIKAQIAEIQTELKQATQTNVSLQKQLTDASKHNTQVITQLKKDVETKQAEVNSQQLMSPANNDIQASVIAQSFLQEAYIQLNINGNPQKAQSLLEKTRLQLQELSDPQFVSLASELQQVSAEIAKTATLDSNEINQKISQLQKASSDLTFAEVNNDENEKAAWYEKLVVIKKVDGSEQKRQSKSEQLSIKSTIKTKFSMLQVALMTKHQNTWTTEIDSLIALLKQNFAENSKDIQTQLTQLKSLDLNPEFPDLEKYVNKLKNIDPTTGG